MRGFLLSSKLNRGLTIAVSLSLLLASGVPLRAQATDGNIVGNVLDFVGAGVAGARVEVQNNATGVRYSAVAGPDGGYRFNNVPVGLYSASGSATGFGAAKLANVQVELNRTTTLNLTLPIASLSTTVEVTSASAAIDTSTAQVQSTYSTKAVIDLPISAVGLGPLNMSLLSAGVASSGGTGLGEGPSVGGQRPRNNSFNVEGVDNNRRDVSGSNVRIPNEATAEVTILQNQFSAEFGHSGGGIFNTVLKGGTNEFHGTAYEYFQNRNLIALDQAYIRQGILDPPRYDNNRLGGDVGGPIRKNKLFFFGLFEYNPIGQASSPAGATYAPTADGYSRLAAIPGLSSTNLNILKQYAGTAPSISGDPTVVKGVSIPLGILPISFPSFQNRYSWVVSGDYNISDRDQLRSRFAANNTAGVDPAVSPNLPPFSQTRNTTSKLFSVSEFHTFSPNISNEMRLGYNRYNDVIPSGSFAYPGLDVFPNIIIQDDLQIQIGPFDGSPQSTILNTYQIVDNLTWTRGRHTLKFGAEGRKYISTQSFIQRQRGDYEYTNLERYLLDLTPDVLAQRNLGGVPYSGNAISFYSFANDSFRVNRNFTLNLGVRYEYKGVAFSDSEHALNASSSRPGLIDFHAPTAQKLNFAPRIGIAYSPGTDGLTSIRAGFGISRDNAPDNFGTNNRPPQLSTTVDDDINRNDTGYLARGGIAPSRRPAALTAAQAVALTSAYIPDQMLPYAIQWNFGIQRVFAKDYTFEARYLGTRGVHLFEQMRLNIQSPVTATRNLPTYLTAPSQATLDALPLTLAQLQSISFYKPDWAAAGFNQAAIISEQNRGNSIYHGLAVEVTRRFSRGLLFNGAYTWSKNIDDGTADLFSTSQAPRRPQDFDDLRSERGRSFLDRTHRLSLAWVYDAQWSKTGNWLNRNIVGNWTLGGVYIYESPQYATVQSGIDSNLNNDAAADRTVINPNGVPGTGSNVTALKNSRGDTVAYVANNPNARYIVAGRGAFPNGGRNTLPLRPIDNIDLNVTKRFHVTESKSLEIRGLFLNAINHPQYTAGPVNDVGVTALPNSIRSNVLAGNPLFNDPTRTFGSNPRTIELVGRFIF